LNWTAFFDAAGLGGQPTFVVWQPTAPVGVAAAVKAVPLPTWKEYLIARAIDRAAPMLPSTFVEAHFAFHNRVLAGTPALPERWKRGVDATNAALGNAVGRMYVEKYFPAAEKERAATLVRGLIAAFGRRLDGLEWMNAATKQKAKAKLAVLKIGVGYPDAWLDYSGVAIVHGDAIGNAERASLATYRRSLAKLGTPVDRGEWVSDPQVVDAYNLPAMNAMNFPAAILQPPYFDRNRPQVMDYGAIGAIIGHEISHSFDDQGALFDAAGKLSNWWTREDFAHFRQQSARLVEQYNAYKPFPDLAVNGKLTLSENIADVAGLAIAYDAYRLSLGSREAPSAQNLTGDQQFFLSFAQMWRAKSREAALRRRILTDGHAPPEYRADTARNLNPWYQAFSAQPGEKLYLGPSDRVSVW
jgi:predicted metalloendopeptidase